MLDRGVSTRILGGWDQVGPRQFAASSRLCYHAAITPSTEACAPVMSIYVIAIITFVLFLSTQVGVPALPALSTELGADATRMAAILSSALMTLVVLQFFSGAVADRWGRKRVLVVSAALGSVSSFLCALAPSWGFLLAMRVAGGIADGLVMPALLAMTAEIAAGKEGSFLGILRSSQGLSFIIGPAIGGWLALSSVRTPFVVDGAASLVACALLWRLLPDGGAVAHGEDLSVFRHLGALLRDRRIYPFILFGLADNLCFPVLAAFLPVKVQSLGYEPWGISLMLTIEAVGFALASAWVGRLSDRWGRKPFVILAQPLIVIACLGLANSTGLAAITAFYTLFGLGGAATFLMSTTMMADITPKGRAATYLGAFDAFIDLGIFIAPAIALRAHAAIGRIDPILLGAALPALVALPAALLVSESRRGGTAKARGS